MTNTLQLLLHIPPKVNTGDSISAVELAELCYQYHYDKRNRLIRKKIPGKGTSSNWESIVYNNLDQPILTQDPNLKEAGKWLYTKYDPFGRVIVTGLHTHPSASQAEMQQIVNDFYAVNDEAWEEKSSSSMYNYYTNNSYPKNNYEVLTLNYYDNYTFDQENLELPAGTVIFDDLIESTTKGLLTGTRVKVLDEAKWITSVNHYNKEGRVIYTASYNDFLVSTDKIKYQLDFMGNVLKTESNHKKGTAPAIVIIDNFTYDHVNRLESHTQSINGGSPEMIAYNSFDELGQLIQKGIGNVASDTIRLQKISYGYNVRGWLKSINDIRNTDKLFNFKLSYNDPTSGTGLYNGNISRADWRTDNTDSGLKFYNYYYDNLNRLTSATANSSTYNVSNITYDKNGNIKTLRRGASNAYMDDLTYNYHNSEISNRLRKVTDAGNVNGFKDGSNTTNEYTYDTNGNLTSDANKGITAITYNHLNLPELVTIGGQIIDYTYDATGLKLKKEIPGKNTEYAGNFIYEGGTLQFISHTEGYVSYDGGQFNYVYNYLDHLGNVRLSYTDANQNNSDPVDLQIIQEKNYYPFGLTHQGYNGGGGGSAYGNAAANRYGFGGKELQDENISGNILDWYDVSARNYDPALGRWMNVDPLAQEFYAWSPYNYTYNNPVNFIDPTGMGPETIYKDEMGNTLANTNDGNNAIVVVANENKEAFKNELENTSVMLKDGARKNEEWISKYGEGMISEEGAKVQSWAVEAMGHDSSYEGLTLATVGVGLAAGEDALKGSTFRLFNKGGSNFSPKIYSSGWNGGSVGRIKTYGFASKALNYAGKFLGAYSVGSTGVDLLQGKTSPLEGTVDMIYGLIGTFGGKKGAFISASYELGKVAGPSKWYGTDDTKWFE